MITFTNDKDTLYLNYSVEYGEEDWVPKALKESGSVRFKRTFYLKKKYFVEQIDPDIEDDENTFDSPTFQFRFGSLKDDYYKIPAGIITRQINIYFHQSIDLNVRHFVADTTTSIFRMIEDIVDEPIYIGGHEPTAIPLVTFESLIDDFPTPYEKKRYAEARISAVLKNYLDTTKDSEAIFQRYMNKRIVRQKSDLQKTFKEVELIKYQTIREKVEEMLADENDYSEKSWQLEILQIVQLLYPKYISILSNVPIRDKAVGDRILDFLLVDNNGHIDIIEIKKPFENSIMTQGKHRNNHIPLRELSGTIMQLEKYIFFLNRWGAEGETYLTKKYSEVLPEGIEIKITNPGGIIIMGRENALNNDQRLDFEVVKRKYKNVVDIITYDNLLHRLKLTIEQIQKL